jgi:hypothetical protein
MWQQAEQGVREVLFMKLPGSCGNLTHLEVCGPHVSTILPTLARTNFSILCWWFLLQEEETLSPNYYCLGYHAYPSAFVQDLEVR